jgi:hypothetical protein
VKTARIILAALTGVALATPAMALNIDWHGDFDNRFSYSTQADLSRRISNDTHTYLSVGGLSNYSGVLNGVDTKKNRNDSDFFGEIKYRLNVNVSDDDKKVKGVLGFEWGASKYGATGADFGGDDNTFELRWAYTDIELPFDASSRLIAGLQPVGFNPLLWSDNAGGVKWVRKDGNWAYSLGWFRNDLSQIGSGNANNDKSDYDDAFGGDLTYTFDNGNNLNAFVIYLDKGKEAKSLANGGLVDGGLNGLVTDAQDQQIWLGLSGKGKWNNYSGQFTGMYLTGEVKTKGTIEDSFDREAYLFHGQVDYKLDKTTFTLGGLYSSGDKNPDDRKLKNFDVIDMGIGFLGSIIIFDNLADDNSFSQSPYLFDKGYALLYAGARHELSSKAWVSARYLWHNTAEDIVVTGQGQGDEIGHEFVLGAGYQLLKGLTAEIYAGYLVAGDAWDALSSTGKGDDVFRTDARLRFTF